ncbi:MAG: FecR domain-containing protein [Cyclobacteriaceae bacterium]|nr:FecR domain-containing protein [Cyclobacteriaceae bacterium]
MADKYDLDRFINDSRFLEYVFEGKHKSYWADYLLRYPENLADFTKAEEWLRSWKFKTHTTSKEKYASYLKKFKDSIYIDSAYEKQVKPAKSADMTWLLKIAAVVVLAIFSIGLVVFLHQQQEIIEVAQEESLPAKVVKTAGRKMKPAFMLSDGTFVRLNSESSIEFPEKFDSLQREVILKGEAFFEVAPDVNRPFIIYCDEMLITVLGTSFNIRSYADDKRSHVAVKSGKVLVRKSDDQPEESKLLEIGEMISLYKDSQKLVKSSFDLEQMFGWTEGKIVFKDADVSEIVKKLERWYDVDINVKLSQSIQRGYSGRFSNVALEYILEGIGFSLGFQYEINGRNVKIYD